MNQASVAVLNRMLAREAWAREKLVPFAGRAVRFEAPPFSMQWGVTDEGTLKPSTEGAPAVTIEVGRRAGEHRGHPRRRGALSTR